MNRRLLSTSSQARSWHGALTIVILGALAWASVGSAMRPTPPCEVSAGVTISRTTVTGTSGNDTIRCENAKRGMTINGGGGSDEIVGGPKADVIHLTDGVVAGRGGNDSITADAGGTSVSALGEEGDDSIVLTALSGTGFSSAVGGPGNDFVNGSPGYDSIEGGDGDDSLNGNAGPDVISGEAGNDQLSGGDGDDRLIDGHCQEATCTSPPVVNDADRYDAGSTGETSGDTCTDYDGTGTGTEGAGVLGSSQDDVISGCETLLVRPTAGT